MMHISEESTSLKNIRKCTLARPTQKCTLRSSAQAHFQKRKHSYVCGDKCGHHILEITFSWSWHSVVKCIFHNRVVCSISGKSAQATLLERKAQLCNHNAAIEKSFQEEESNQNRILILEKAI